MTVTNFQIYAIVSSLIGLYLLVKLIKWIFFPYIRYKQIITKTKFRKITIFEPNKEPKDDIEPYLYNDGDEDIPYLTVVIPCFNEVKRLPPNFAITLDHLRKLFESRKQKFEIVLVNDGSKDATLQMIKDYIDKYKDESNFVIRGVSLSINSGKGGALKKGVLYSRGKNILLIDADGATDFECYSSLQDELNKISRSDKGIVVGSRKVGIKANRKWYRRFLSWGYSCLLYILYGIKVKDTQCGFKLLRKESAKLLSSIHIEGFAFDVELLYLAYLSKTPVGEVAVRWNEVLNESKVSVIKEMARMGRDAFMLKFLYFLKIWKSSDRSTK